MAQDSKYGQIDIPGIPADEPVFIIRGKDVAAPEAVRGYAEEAGLMGASADFQRSVESRANEIEAWQEDNASLCDIPD